MRTAIVVGDPCARSGTFKAAVSVITGLTGGTPDLAIDLVDIGGELLDSADCAVTELISALAETDVSIFASPVRGGTYTGMLKLFLDRIPDGALSRVTAIAMMTGMDPRQAMAPDIYLIPTLFELGARSSARGLFLLHSEIGDCGVLRRWLDTERPWLPTELDTLRM